MSSFKDELNASLEASLSAGMRDGAMIRIKDLEAEVERVKDAAKAYQDLAVCYRIGKQPTEKLFASLKRAKETLEGE